MAAADELRFRASPVGEDVRTMVAVGGEPDGESSGHSIGTLTVVVEGWLHPWYSLPLADEV